MKAHRFYRLHRRCGKKRHSETPPENSTENRNTRNTTRPHTPAFHRRFGLPAVLPALRTKKAVLPTCAYPGG